MMSGRKQHPKSKRALGVGGLRLYYGDPPSVRRIADDSAGPDLWLGLPTQPSFPLVGVYTNLWQFRSALDVDTTNVLVEKNDNAGTSLAIQDERGGIAKVTTATGDNDYYYYMSKSEPGQLSRGKRLWFTGDIAIGDVDQADWFFGLCSRETGADALFDDRENAVGFYGVDGSALIRAECSKSDAATQDTSGNGSLVDDTMVTLGFHVTGLQQAQFFVRNRYVCTILTNLPTECMCFAFGIRNGTSAANTMRVSTSFLMQTK